MNKIICFLVLVTVTTTNASGLEKVLGQDIYELVEGKDIMLACMANLENEYGYSILWSVDSKRLSNTSSGGDIVIINSQSGTNITSTVVLKNASKYDSDKLMFVECELHDSDGRNVEQKSFTVIVIHVNDMLNVTASTTKTKIEVGDKITLLCNACGKIANFKLNITWSKDGKVLTHIQQASAGAATALTYNITKVTGSVGGIYECRASVMVDEKLFQDNDTISLSVIPKLIGEERKPSSYCMTRERVVVRCEIDGYPLSITWQKKSFDGTTRVISDDSRFKIADNGRELTIYSFQSDDATDFSCKNMGQGGKDIVQTFTFIERVLPTIKNDEKIRNVIFIPGRPKILECKVFAVPSCVFWNTSHPDNEEKLDVNDIPGVFPPNSCNKTLWFKNVSEVVNGQNFSCAVGTVKQTFTVIKMTKPRLTGSPTKEVKAEKGDNVSLKCDIEVNPLNVTWMVDDRFLNASFHSNYVIQASDDPRVLVIPGVDYDDGGSFYCSAKNALDEKGVRQEIILRIKDPLKTRNVWLVVGIVIVILVVAIIVGIAVYYCKKRRASPNSSARSAIQADGSDREVLPLCDKDLN